jgi:hypothetical protein
MSKVRNLPEVTVLEDADLVYVVDTSEGANAGRKATIATVRTAVVSQAQDIPYNNNDSTLSAENVKAAIDELDDKVNDHDFRHLPDNSDALDTAAPDTNLSPATTNAIGSANSFARSNHTHAISTALVADITAMAPDNTSLAGTAANFARGDHRHGIPTDAPTVDLSPASTNDEGVGTSFARNDHTHLISTALVGVISTIEPDDAASAGTSDTYSRGDHKHSIVTTAPTTTLSPATSNAEGVATSFARGDHTHAVETGLVGDLTTIQPDDAAAAGTVDRFARADHRHAIVTAAPSNTGSANSEGASTSFARADHIHNTTIANSVASATTDDTTASLTDVLIVGMTLTPAAGTYLATFSSSVLNSGNGASRLFVSIYSNAVQVAHSEREIGISGGANVPVQTNAVVTVNGSQAIEARWRAVAGTNTAHERSLTIIRLGD